MSKVSVNVKMEDKVRDEAKLLFRELGLDMTTAVNLFLITAIREKSIPFSISAVDHDLLQQRFEAQLCEDLKTSEQEIEAGRVMSLSSAMDSLRTV